MTATTLADQNVERAIAQSKPITRPHRRREIDVIGPLVVIAVMVFHSLAVFFDSQVIVNESQSRVTDLVTRFVGVFFVLWGMPLMMLFAGTTIWHNLRKRTLKEFVWERFKRLLVPFCTGLVLAIPPMVYFKAKQASGYNCLMPWNANQPGNRS